MIQPTYYAPPEPAEPAETPGWESAPTDVHTLRWGYNLADLDRLAHIATASAYAQIGDRTDRFEAAWHAIAEALYTATSAPSPAALKTAGMRAISRLCQDYRQTWGLSRTDASVEIDGFRKYWELDRRSAPSPEDMIVDRMSLWQIWPTLSDNHRAILHAMAITRDNQAAAELVSKSYATFNTTLKDARARFRALWHEHETPSRMWGKGDRRHGEKLPGTKTLRNRRQQRARRVPVAAKPKPPRTQCSNGHPIGPGSVNAAGRCRACATGRSQRYRTRKREQP